MSDRKQVLLTSGVLILVVLSMAMSFYYTSRANETVEEVQRLILEGRQIGNMRGNATLGAVGEAIMEIKTIQTELRDNLTSHRIVTNNTNDQLQELISQFNQTNEVERQKAVATLQEGINNNTKLLKRLLSITP